MSVMLLLKFEHLKNGEMKITYKISTSSDGYCQHEREFAEVTALVTIECAQELNRKSSKEKLNVH